MQVGFVVYPAGGEVERARPRAAGAIARRDVRGAARPAGRCEMDLYDDERALVATRELAAGDVILIVAGGHGFRMLEDTTFLEVKQGPYTGLVEKERF